MPSGGNGYELYILQSDSKLYMTIGGSTTGAGDTTSSSTDHHLIITKQGADYNFYLDNGTPKAFNGSNGTPGTTLGIGVALSAPTVRCFNGWIDEVAVWDRVITSDERVELYNSGSGIGYPG